MTSTSCLRWLRAEIQHNGLKWVTFRRSVFWFSPWELSLVCFIFYLLFFYCSSTFWCCSWFFFFPQNSPLRPPHPRAYVTQSQRAPCEGPPVMATLCLARIWARTAFLIIRWVRICIAFPISPNSVFVFEAALLFVFVSMSLYQARNPSLVLLPDEVVM